MYPTEQRTEERWARRNVELGSRESKIGRVLLYSRTMDHGTSIRRRSDFRRGQGDDTMQNEVTSALHDDMRALALDSKHHCPSCEPNMIVMIRASALDWIGREEILGIYSRPESPLSCQGMVRTLSVLSCRSRSASERTSAGSSLRWL